MPRSTRQLSLFGVEAVDPSPADLAGLLAGPAELGRMGGTARISVVVDHAWRVHVLIAEFAARGLTATWAPADQGRLTVRTAYATSLAALAAAWLDSGTRRPPEEFYLTGARLRMWVAAAGVADPPGYVLPLGPTDEVGRARIGAALAAVGLPAALVDTGSGETAYRITGRRSLARLAELVGPRPAPAPPENWPG
ncbi:MAG TPA: hypothetical protein VIL44_09770 [Micromonospora sp.]